MTVINQERYSDSEFPLHKLGQLDTDQWGRKFRYVQAGGTALVTGHLVQEPAEVTNFYSMVVQAASAIGSTSISVTLGGTAVTAGQFASGDLVVESAAGLGQSFKILSHTVQTSTTGTCIFEVDHALDVALTTSSQVTVRKNSYDGVVDFPVTPTGAPVGFALFAVTAEYHAWIHTGGDTAVLFDNQTNVAADDSGIVPSEDVAGSVSAAEAADAAPTSLGFSRAIVSIDSTFGMAHITLD